MTLIISKQLLKQRIFLEFRIAVHSSVSFLTRPTHEKLEVNEVNRREQVRDDANYPQTPCAHMKAITFPENCRREI